MMIGRAAGVGVGANGKVGATGGVQSKRAVGIVAGCATRTAPPFGSATRAVIVAVESVEPGATAPDGNRAATCAGTAIVVTSSAGMLGVVAAGAVIDAAGPMTACTGPATGADPARVGARMVATGVARAEPRFSVGPLGVSSARVLPRSCPMEAAGE